LRTIKIVLIILAAVTLLGVVSVLTYSHGKTYRNDKNEIGNSSGNIYNGGLFCQKDDSIYFSNDDDDGCLYVMDSLCSRFRKISTDKAVYINVDHNYIYYARANNTREQPKRNFLAFNNTGIYRMSQNGSDLKCVSRMPGAYLTLAGNSLYYQGYDASVGLYLYHNGIECTNEKVLIRDAVIPAAVSGGWLYYTSNAGHYCINAMNLTTLAKQKLANGSFANPVFFGNYIYYMNMKDDYKIYRMNKNGSGSVRMVDARCCTFNITNNGLYLYYQVDGSHNNRICRLNLKTMESKTLSKGNYKQIHVTKNYVFFKNFDNSTTYYVSAEGSAQVSIFNPPHLRASGK
jgi:hypothetical protein